MALSVPSEPAFTERQTITEIPSVPTTSIEQDIHEIDRKQHLRPDSSIDTGNRFFRGNGPLQLKDHYEKIEFTEFDFNKPWLPSETKKLLDKFRKAPGTERNLVRLMEMVAERASIHFELSKGKFVAMTFHGQIMEVADTRVGLLKKIHGRRYAEQIFVWRIGSKTFSGRI